MSDLVTIPDLARGSVWYVVETNCLFIRYAVHWHETCASVENEGLPGFCPALEYNFIYIGEL